MFLRIFTAIAFNLAGLLSDHLLPSNPCQSIPAIQARLSPILAPLHGELLILSGSDAAVYLDVVNSTPPETDLHSDGILLAVIPNTYVTIGLINSNHACAAIRIGIDTHLRAMEAVRSHHA